MKIIVNGKAEEIKEGLSILDFLYSKELQPDEVVVELNFKIIKKEEQKKTYLKENDSLEILRFVGGG